MSSRRQFGALRRLPSGRYQASYVGPDGFRRSASTTFPTKADGKAWLTLREAELLRGEWLDPDRGRVLFGDYGQRWIAEHKLGPRTREEYERQFRLHVRPYLGHEEVGRLSPEAVRTWRAAMLSSGRSLDTAAKSYRLVRSIMTTTVDDGRARRNPCRIRGADTASRAERPVATVAQLYALAAAIGPRWRVFVLTAGLTSLRWGELIALRRVDVDLDGLVINVHRSFAQLAGGRIVVVPPKSAAGVRRVTLPPVLVADLSSHLAEHVGLTPEAAVFTGEKGATPKRGSWHSTVRWTGLVVEVGLPKGFHFHDLRHTGNHLASVSGASTRELMQRMGHSTMRAALVYQHATDERAREIAERLSQVVEAAREADG